MTDTRYRLLPLAGALAAGEALASRWSALAELWPLAAALALAAALFGHAFALPLRKEAAVFLAGIALFFASAVDSEQLYREKPWMRDRVRRRSSCAAVHPRLAEVRRDFSRRLAVGVDDDRLSVGLSRAILLGEKTGIPRDVKRMFAEAGTVHIFAISGLHVMVVAAVIMAALSVLQVPPRWCGALSLPLLWGYVAMIGAPPSAVRAAAMATFGCIAPVFRRRPDPLTAWSLTFFAVHVFSPRLIGDVGCRLSFAVMLGIVLASEFVSGGSEGRRRPGLCVPLAAWAAGVPIAAAVFGRITPGGILANALLLPAAGAAVWAGAGGIAASFVSESLAAHLNNLSALFIDAMVAVSAAVSDLPWANIETGEISTPVALAWYAAAALPFALRRWVRSRKCF